MKRTAIFLISGLVLALLLAACGSDDPEPPTGVDSPDPPEAASAGVVKAASQTIVGTEAAGDDAAASSGGGCEDGTALTVELQDPAGSGEYVFDPSALSFATGECVNFTFTSETEFHTFTVDALEIDVSVDAEATETFSFTFASAGEFELICVPHEALGMVGTITVSE